MKKTYIIPKTEVTITEPVLPLAGSDTIPSGGSNYNGPTDADVHESIFDEEFEWGGKLIHNS